MTNEPSEFETPSAPNKDMWLFLIVLDVIVLCVLGFLLYNHFSARVFQAPSLQQASVQTTPDKPTVLEEVVVTEQEVLAPAVQPISKPTEKSMAAEKPALAKEPAPVHTEPAVAKEVPASPQPLAEEKESQTDAKQSIVVTPVAGSKYRRVTFKWFAPAQRVAIVSGFTNRQPQALRQTGDHWQTTLAIAPGTYKFLYIVDGKNTLDPYAEQKDGRSVLVVK